jgi:hypothetical protein
LEAALAAVAQEGPHQIFVEPPVAVVLEEHQLPLFLHLQYQDQFQ